MDNRSISARLEEKGFTVTDRVGRSLGVRMIVDSNGNDVGFLSPLDCILELKI